MPHYDFIQPLVFRLADAERPFQITMWTIVFPDAWKTILHELQSAQSGRDPAESRLKIGVLNQALRALVPDLIAIEPNADTRNASRWLIARQPTDVQALHQIVTEWVRVAYANVDQQLRRRALQSLKPDDLQWNQQEFTIGEWNVLSNGTAELSNDSFVLLPDMLAARLSHDHVAFQLGVDRLRFRRSPPRFRSQGAELISWPPLQWTARRGRPWYYSVVITLTVHTVPFQPFPVIHCDLSMRRWVSQPVTFLPDRASVFLLTSVPWIEGAPLSTGFQAARIRWKRSDADGASGQYVWDDNLASILNRLTAGRRSFPDPAAICANPIGALNLSGDWHAALTYRDGMRPDHQVHPGVPAKKRRELAEQIVDQLRPLVTFANPWPRIYPTRTFRIPGGPCIFDADRQRQAAPSLHQERRKTIAQVVGHTLPIEIYVQNAQTRDVLIRTIEDMLGVHIGDTFPAYVTTNELCLTVHVHPLGEIGDRLVIPPTGGKFSDRFRSAVRARIKAITDRIPPEEQLVAAFVELQGADYFHPDEDPKRAIRAGFAQQNRLTQFLDAGGDTDSLPHRVRNSVLDMLRQLGIGFRIPPFDCLGTQRLNLVGLWLVTRQPASSSNWMQQSLPVFVHIDAQTQHIIAYAPGLEKWLPYPRALLALAHAAAEGRLKAFQRPCDALPFLRKTIEHELAGAGDTLLLVHAQNARAAWRWLENRQLTQDAFAFGREPPQPISKWHGLRILRIRDSRLHETPEWYAAKPDGGAGTPKGLFVVRERVFASTHGKPSQFRKARHGGELSELTWNPAIVEVASAALQPGDEPSRWAAYAHELRFALCHYEGATILPLPLHLAKMVSEYAVSLDALDEADDEESEEADV
ncbi:MAG: DUF3962 domain-containing protein [Roseiflexaceae bacterium]|nr:DUF3962 domain-containing protein [Roseiflexaceae bacterium]